MYTSHGAWCAMWFATLPRSLPGPCMRTLPTKMTEASIRLAASRMTLSGLPRAPGHRTRAPNPQGYADTSHTRTDREPRTFISPPPSPRTERRIWCRSPRQVSPCRSTDLVARSRMPARALLDLRHARLRSRSADLAPRRSVLPIGWVAAAHSGQSVRFSSHLPGVRGQGGDGLRRCGFWDAAPTRHAPVRAPAGWLSAWMVLQAVRRQMVA